MYSHHEGRFLIRTGEDEGRLPLSLPPLVHENRGRYLGAIEGYEDRRSS